VTLATTATAIPIFTLASANPSRPLVFATNANPHLSQETTLALLLIFRQLGHCFDMLTPPPLGSAVYTADFSLSVLDPSATFKQI
jgi:hypothetical protein